MCPVICIMLEAVIGDVYSVHSPRFDMFFAAYSDEMGHLPHASLREHVVLAGALQAFGTLRTIVARFGPLIMLQEHSCKPVGGLLAKRAEIFTYDDVSDWLEEEFGKLYLEHTAEAIAFTEQCGQSPLFLLYNTLLVYHHGEEGVLRNLAWLGCLLDRLVEAGMTDLVTREVGENLCHLVHREDTAFWAVSQPILERHLTHEALELVSPAALVALARKGHLTELLPRLPKSAFFRKTNEGKILLCILPARALGTLQEVFDACPEAVLLPLVPHGSALHELLKKPAVTPAFVEHIFSTLGNEARELCLLTTSFGHNLLHVAAIYAERPMLEMLRHYVPPLLTTASNVDGRTPFDLYHLARAERRSGRRDPDLSDLLLASTAKRAEC